MGIAKYREILGWRTIVNYGLLGLAVLMFLFAHDWMYAFHSGWFGVSAEAYDALWFITIALWKVVILVFNLVPYIVLRIVDKNGGIQE